MADAKVGPVLKAITDKAAAARGDVAAAVKDNPALVAMMERAMQRMTVEECSSRQAQTPRASQLNRVLQGIKKGCVIRCETYCNPLDLGYRYQHMKGGGAHRRFPRGR